MGIAYLPIMVFMCRNSDYCFFFFFFFIHWHSDSEICHNESVVKGFFFFFFWLIQFKGERKGEDYNKKKTKGGQPNNFSNTTTTWKLLEMCQLNGPVHWSGRLNWLFEEAKPVQECQRYNYGSNQPKRTTVRKEAPKMAKLDPSKRSIILASLVFF
jgi:hypothetical protein